MQWTVETSARWPELGARAISIEAQSKKGAEMAQTRAVWPRMLRIAALVHVVPENRFPRLLLRLAPFSHSSAWLPIGLNPMHFLNAPDRTGLFNASLHVRRSAAPFSRRAKAEASVHTRHRQRARAQPERSQAPNARLDGRYAIFREREGMRRVPTTRRPLGMDRPHPMLLST